MQKYFYLNTPQIRKNTKRTYRNKKTPHIILVSSIIKNRREIPYVSPYYPIKIVSLYNYISKYGSLNEHQAYCIFNQILGTVSKFLEININILFIPRSKIYINPFTLETQMVMPKICTKNTASSILYSSYYAPPEIIISNKYYKKTLLSWNLGILLYYMLNAKMPFTSKWDIVHSPIVLPCPQLLSVTLKSFLYWCFTKNPHKRITFHEILFHPWST